MADNTEACTFIKKSFKNKNMRKRTVNEDADEEEVGPAVPAKSSKKVHEAAQRSEKDEIKEGPGSFFYESTKQIQTENDNNATATRETETAFDRDARAIRERILKQADDSLKGKSSVEDKLYKGLHGYTDHKAGFRREHTISGEKAGGAHGPLRASAHIRWSVRFDYQPDICKDYKETGYCGYGDACKFMHDRGDYKSGWQIDREWDEAEKIKKEKLMQRLEGEDVKEEDEDDDELPFACFICREPYTNPVVTHCKHYFCERCALEHHRRDKHCYVCNKPTSGVFNTAHEILKREKDKTAASNS